MGYYYFLGYTWDNWVGSREKYWEKTQFTSKKKVGENSDIGLMKMKNKGSGKVYKMVGRTTCFNIFWIQQVSSGLWASQTSLSITSAAQVMFVFSIRHTAQSYFSIRMQNGTYVFYKNGKLNLYLYLILLHIYIYNRNNIRFH